MYFELQCVPNVHILFGKLHWLTNLVFIEGWLDCTWILYMHIQFCQMWVHHLDIRSFCSSVHSGCLCCLKVLVLWVNCDTELICPNLNIVFVIPETYGPIKDAYFTFVAMQGWCLFELLLLQTTDCVITSVQYLVIMILSLMGLVCTKDICQMCYYCYGCLC